MVSLERGEWIASDQRWGTLQRRGSEMNSIHNAIERRNFLQFDILTNQRVGLNKTDAKGLTPLMKVNHEPNKANATEMVCITPFQLCRLWENIWYVMSDYVINNDILM